MFHQRRALRDIRILLLYYSPTSGVEISKEYPILEGNSMHARAQAVVLIGQTAEAVPKQTQ